MAQNPQLCCVNMEGVLIPLSSPSPRKTSQQLLWSWAASTPAPSPWQTPPESKNVMAEKGHSGHVFDEQGKPGGVQALRSPWGLA